MSLSFLILAAFTLACAVAAMTLRIVVHCVLALALTFAGLAALFLQLNAQFAGFAQLLVYVGAVGILIVFAILLTKGGGPAKEPIFSPGPCLGFAIGLGLLGILIMAIFRSHIFPRAATPPIEVHVQDIGAELMTTYVLPLEIVGLLLTAAMIGAVVLALKERPEP